jgi:hypothetical protein
VTIQDCFFPLTIRLPDKLASLSLLIWNHHRICQIIIIDHFSGLVVARFLFLPAFCHHPFFLKSVMRHSSLLVCLSSGS